MSRFLHCIVLGLVALALQAAAPVAAQTIPSRITIVVPFPPGGPTDVIGRVVAQKLGQALNTTVIIDNRPGAAGLIGTQSVARADKDGSVLLIYTNSMVLNLVMVKNPGYKFEDFAPITAIYENPMLLCVRADIPVNNVKEFLAYAKSRPGKLNAGVIGTGSSYSLMMGTLREQSGVDIVDVVYKGSADSMRDLLGGQIDMMFTDPVVAIPQMKDGKIKILATASKHKASGLDIPTFDELGMPIEGGAILTGLYAPAGTPQALINRLNEETVKIVKSPEYQDALKNFGSQPLSSSAAEFEKDLREKLTAWTAVRDRIKYEPQ